MSHTNEVTSLQFERLWTWILKINLFVFRQEADNVKHSAFLLLTLVLQFFVLIIVSDLLIIISVLQGSEVAVGLVTQSKRREGKSQPWYALPILSPEQKKKK